MPKTIPKPDPWDGGDAPQRLVDETNEGLDRAMQKLKRLQKFLNEHGISTVVIMSTYDQLTDLSHCHYSREGDAHALWGATQKWLNWQMED